MPWRENKGVCQFKRSHGLHDYLSSEFRRMLDGNKIFTELSHVGKLREVREVREKLRDKCSTSYGKRLLSLNFPNDRRE